MPPKVLGRALIIGGSVGGLFVALLLRRVGWHVDVFERSGTELSGRGAGIVTHDEIFAVLRRAGIALDPLSLGVPVPGRRVFGADGDTLRQLALPQVLTTWGRLHAVLRESLPDRAHHAGMDLRSIEETPTAVIAHFANDAQEQADLLIGADGLNSTVRRQFLPEVVPVYAGYVAWRGLVDEADLSSGTRASLCDWFAFSLPPGEQMLGYPVAGADGSLMPGRRRFNFVWYRPANAGEALAALLTDTGGIRHELSIPPDRIRPAIIARMRADSERLLAPQFAEVVRRTQQPFLQAIIDLDSPRMAPGQHGRVAIVGDAAFVARPHVGMGVTKAASDACALAAAVAELPGELPAALARFERDRLARGSAITRRARALGAYLQAQISNERDRRMAEQYRSLAAIITETATTTGLSPSADRT